jgi:hypothetical protein
MLLSEMWWETMGVAWRFLKQFNVFCLTVRLTDLEPFRNWGPNRAVVYAGSSRSKRVQLLKAMCRMWAFLWRSSICYKKHKKWKRSQTLSVILTVCTLSQPRPKRESVETRREHSGSSPAEFWSTTSLNTEWNLLSISCWVPEIYSRLKIITLHPVQTCDNLKVRSSDLAQKQGGSQHRQFFISLWKRWH